MAIAEQHPVYHSYQEKGVLDPFVGWFECFAGLGGDGTGGDFTLDVIPNAHSERVYRIDHISVRWAGGVGDAISEVAISLPQQRPGDFYKTVEYVDTSGAAQGTQVIALHNPVFWQTQNKDDAMVRWDGTNTNGQTIQMVVRGVFFEPR